MLLLPLPPLPTATAFSFATPHDGVAQKFRVRPPTGLTGHSQSHLWTSPKGCSVGACSSAGTGGALPRNPSGTEHPQAESLCYGCVTVNVQSGGGEQFWSISGRQVGHFGPRDGRFSPILAIFGALRCPILVKLSAPTRPIFVDTGVPKRAILVKLGAAGGPISVNFGPPRRGGHNVAPPNRKASKLQLCMHNTSVNRIET